MGPLREAARDRDWQGGLGLAHCRRGSVEFVVMIYQARLGRVCSYDLSKFAAAFTQFRDLSAHEARRHGTKQGDCYQSPLPSLTS
jgi:hypothetical protein